MLCQFLDLAGKRFWFNFGSNTYLLLRVQYSCGREIGSFFVVAGKFYYDRKKKSQSSVWRVVLLCQFLVLAGNRFWLYILLCTWSTIQLWCCVIFFGSGRK